MHNGLPILYTQRLTLRASIATDIPSLLKYVNNRKITDNILNFPFPYVEYHAVMRIANAYSGFGKKTHYVFAIIFRELEPEELVGEVSLNLDKQNNTAQLGYWVGEPFWNQHIASEAVEAIIRFGFEKLGLASIFAECQMNNKGSEKVMIRNNMVKQGENSDIVRYAINQPAHPLPATTVAAS